MPNEPHADHRSALTAQIEGQVERLARIGRGGHQHRVRAKAARVCAHQVDTAAVVSGAMAYCAPRLLGQAAPFVLRIDAHHVHARGARHLHREQPQHTQTHYDDGLAELTICPPQAVDCHRAERHERRVSGRESGRNRRDEIARHRHALGVHRALVAGAGHQVAGCAGPRRRRRSPARGRPGCTRATHSPSARDSGMRPTPAHTRDRVSCGPCGLLVGYWSVSSASGETLERMMCVSVPLLTTEWSVWTSTSCRAAAARGRRPARRGHREQGCVSSVDVLRGRFRRELAQDPFGSFGDVRLDACGRQGRVPVRGMRPAGPGGSGRCRRCRRRGGTWSAAAFGPGPSCPSTFPGVGDCRVRCRARGGTRYRGRRCAWSLQRAPRSPCRRRAAAARAKSSAWGCRAS